MPLVLFLSVAVVARVVVVLGLGLEEAGNEAGGFLRHLPVRERPFLLSLLLLLLEQRQPRPPPPPQQQQQTQTQKQILLALLLAVRVDEDASERHFNARACPRPAVRVDVLQG